MKQNFLLSALPRGRYLLCHPLVSLPSSLQTVLPHGSCYKGIQSYKEISGRRCCFLHLSTDFCLNVWSQSFYSIWEELDPASIDDSDKSSTDFSGSEKGFINCFSGSPPVLQSYAKLDSSLPCLEGWQGKRYLDGIDLSGILIQVQYVNNEIYVMCVCIGNTAQIKMHGINHTHNIYSNTHICIHILIL